MRAHVTVTGVSEDFYLSRGTWRVDSNLLPPHAHATAAAVSCRLLPISPLDVKCRTQERDAQEHLAYFRRSAKQRFAALRIREIYLSELFGWNNKENRLDRWLGRRRHGKDRRRL